MYFIIMDVMKIYNINSLSITRISIFVGNRFGGSFKTWDGTRHYFFLFVRRSATFWIQHALLNRRKLSTIKQYTYTP